MTLPESELAAYRPAVGIMLLDRAGRAFVGRRTDMPAGLAAWQMPQGGIDPGETPREAALRELEEEVGTNKAEIVAETRGWLHYDLPPEIARTSPAPAAIPTGCGAGAIGASGRNGSRCALPARIATSTRRPASIPNSTPGNGSRPTGCRS